MATWAADAVYLNGKIVTWIGADTIAEALAVKGESSLAVGSTRDERTGRGPAPRWSTWAARPSCRASTTLTPTRPCTAAADRRSLSTSAFRRSGPSPTSPRWWGRGPPRVKPGEWIRGNGWDDGYLDECLADPSRRMTRADLDEVAPDNPGLPGGLQPAPARRQQPGPGACRHHPGHHDRAGLRGRQGPGDGGAHRAR